MRRLRIAFFLGVLGAALLAAAGAQAEPGRFPSSDPNPRVGTPDDPNYDCSEPDDEDADVEDCPSIYDEQFNLFGFAPASTRNSARYAAGPKTGGQISGISADIAWKSSIGSPSVPIAIQDTGVRWDNLAIRRQIWLNVGELPRPQGAASHDADGDGAVTVDDWAGDPRVDPAQNDTEERDNEFLDGQDLIVAFSDGTDGDGNGYIDDIAGWDFFDDDNDPDDVSSYSSARNHGTGRAREAAEQTDDAEGAAGVCPRCRLMMLREWDSFVVPGDNYAAATVYAADNGAKSQVIANGVLQNTDSAEAATRYAHRKGVALMHVSSDLNTADHNYPTNYRESIFINGCVTDTQGFGFEAPGISDILNELGVLDSQVPPGTFFRNSNLTQFGAHAHVCTMAVTGSAATGQAGGAAGLLMSRGLEAAESIGGPLTVDELKQILTLTAEDVLPQNTNGVGPADPSQPGFDERFGYGRADLGAAMARIAPGTIPPEAWIDGPAWWALLDPVEQPTVPVVAHIAANRSSGYSYELQWAPGVQPLDAAFQTFAEGDGNRALDGVIGQIPMDEVAAALPGSVEGTPPTNPNRYVFTVRLVVTDAQGNRAEDRKAYHAFHDPTLQPGWPVFADTGGESSPVLYDLDGDATLEVIDADSSGRLFVRRADGTNLPSFNGGQHFQPPPSFFHHPNAPGFKSGSVPPPTGGWRPPAIADIDGDLTPEIVAAAGDGRLYVFESDGRVSDGFPVGVDPALSARPLRTVANHVKRGFLAAPTIADLDRDGSKEILASALDGHVYVWGADGRIRPGFPVKLADPDVEEFYGGELIATPAVGDLDGDGTLEIVTSSSEIYDPDGSPPNSPTGLEGAVTGALTNALANAAGASSRIYALNHDGTLVEGWPVAINGLAPDVLPLVGPAHVPALADIDNNGDVEVVASITSGDVTLYNGNGSVIRVLDSDGQRGNAMDRSRVLNLFEYPVVGDTDGDAGLEISKGGLTLNGLMNLVLVGQNLPFNHVVQAWDAENGRYKQGFPTVTDDYQLLSTPAIANVNDTAGGELLVGTGLYLLHAYTSSGGEAAEFPKLAGGWIIGTPAVGDADADGTLEVAVVTREGYRFVWDLDTANTVTGNDEWWTESHDECHTNAYGTDCRPPARIQDLRLSRTGDPTAFGVTFSATGDDWLAGTAAGYEVRFSEQPITSFADFQAARPVAEGVPTLSEAGLGEAFVVNRLPVGTRSVAVVAFDEAGNASQLAAASLEGVDDGVVIERLQGPGRVETAIAISQRNFDRADRVVLARADTYPDALAGAPLAVHLGGPLLLSNSERLSERVRDEIFRLQATEVVLLGGDQALSEAVFDDVRALAADVRRVFGQNRFETAAAVSRELPPSPEVLVAEGGDPDPNRGWPDALSAAGLGAARRLPILLVTTESLPDSTRRALGPDQRVTIIGGVAAVGGEVQAAIDEQAGIVGRIAGDNRYATSALAADEALRRGVDPAVLYLATGLNYPDGLAAGAAAGAANGALLLVDGQNLSASPESRQWLADHSADLFSVRLAGGTDAITAAVEQELIRLLG